MRGNVLRSGRRLWPAQLPTRMVSNSEVDRSSRRMLLSAQLISKWHGCMKCTSKGESRLWSLRLFPSRLPFRPLPHTVVMNPVERSMRRMRWLPESATYM